MCFVLFCFVLFCFVLFCFVFLLLFWGEGGGGSEGQGVASNHLDGVVRPPPSERTPRVLELSYNNDCIRPLVLILPDTLILRVSARTQKANNVSYYIPRLLKHSDIPMEI